MRRRLLLGALLLTLLAFTSMALAQGGYDLSWWTVDSGGGESSGGGYALSGSIGQPDASDELVGGSYTLVSGFGGGAPSPPVVSPPPFNLSWFTVDGGGGVSGGGGYTLGGSIGQHDASDELVGGSYTLVSGFGGGVAAPSVAGADLSLTKSADPDPVTVGQNLTYTLTVTNNGPDTATGVTLTDNLPAGVTFVSATPGSPTCSESGDTVTCNLETITSGDAVTVEIVVSIDSSTIGAVTNTASVTSEVDDPDTASNSVTVATQVALSGDLNGDGKVDLDDLMTVGLAFGSNPGDAHWNEKADVNEDGTVNIIDLVIVALTFGIEM